MCMWLAHVHSQLLLQHTATHCNALQHTATPCHTLQHTATHCITLQHIAKQWCFTLYNYCTIASKPMKLVQYWPKSLNIRMNYVNSITGPFWRQTLQPTCNLHMKTIMEIVYTCMFVYRWIYTRTRPTATLCSTLQHAATHCNTLQHTAPHCNTLQHTETHCNILQHTVTHSNTLQENAAWTSSVVVSTLQRTATHCIALQHTAPYRNTWTSSADVDTLQRTAKHSNTLQHTATHRNTLQHMNQKCGRWHTATHCTLCKALQRLN